MTGHAYKYVLELSPGMPLTGCSVCGNGVVRVRKVGTANMHLLRDGEVARRE